MTDEELDLLIKEYELLHSESKFNMKLFYRTFYLSIIFLAVTIQVFRTAISDEQYSLVPVLSGASVIIFIIFTGWMYNFIVGWESAYNRMTEIQIEIQSRHPNTFKSITTDKIWGESPSGTINRGWLKFPSDPLSSIESIFFDVDPDGVPRTIRWLNSKTSSSYFIIWSFNFPVICAYTILFIYSLINL